MDGGLSRLLLNELRQCKKSKLRLRAQAILAGFQRCTVGMLSSNTTSATDTTAPMEPTPGSAKANFPSCVVRRSLPFLTSVTETSAEAIHLPVDSFYCSAGKPGALTLGGSNRNQLPFGLKKSTAATPKAWQSDIIGTLLKRRNDRSKSS
jgi:hypothetical protein